MGRDAGVTAVLLLMAQPCLAGAGCPAGHGHTLGPLGLYNCSLCGPGTWSNGSGSKCTKCTPGRWSGIIGATEAAVCAPCLPGYWSSEVGAVWRHACKPCAVGRYGTGEGLSSEDACASCPAGTFSGVLGATASATCTKCPRGRYGTQSAAANVSSCVPCSAGYWSSEEGISSPFLCKACPTGSWGEKAGASEKTNCTLCPAGRWSGVHGASDRAACLECPAGTWSAREGAVARSACVPCAAGTWSSTPGAKSPFACKDCPAGKAQPQPGMSDSGKCIDCSPGTHSNGPGSSECTLCQRGSWTNTTASAWCRACPTGKWTTVTGAVLQERCGTCRGHLHCLGGSTAHLEIKFPGFSLISRNQATVTSAFVSRIAAACAVDERAIVSPFGVSASVALDETGLVEAYIMVPMNYSVNAMAEQLYAASFRKSMQEVTAKTLGAVPKTFEVNIQPKIFERLPMPPSAITALTRTGTRTMLSMATTATKVAADGGAAEHFGFLWWAWLIVVAIGLGGSLVAVMLAGRCKTARSLLGGRGKAAAGGARHFLLKPPAAGVQIYSPTGKHMTGFDGCQIVEEGMLA